jgi:hypothetical protein
LNAGIGIEETAFKAGLKKLKRHIVCAFKKVYQEWSQIRGIPLRTEPCQKWTIEIMYDDTISGQWKVIALKCTEPYRPEVLFDEVKTWIRREGGWSLRGDECRQIRDEDGLVDRGDLRNPREGERYAISLQTFDEIRRLEVEARIKKFIAETRWRRLKSRYKIETVEIESVQGPPKIKFESVEAGICRNHTRYRQRFKKRRKILTDTLEDSPLISGVTFEDAGELVVECQDGTQVGLGCDLSADSSRFESGGSGDFPTPGVGTATLDCERSTWSDAPPTPEFEDQEELDGVAGANYH